MGHDSQISRFCRTGCCLLTTLVLFLFSIPVLADYIPIYHPELEISRAAGDIDIDGLLDDAGWQGAAKADNFAEHNPGDQTEPEVPTEVLITYNDDNLYVAWICYDDPAEVRATFCERDRIFNDDFVILCIDPFGDATLAYEICANPYGIPGDLLYSSANGEDSSYDMIFESAGRINGEGWIVEMEIPFASMRFPQQDEQAWRVDFWRNRPRESRYQYSWAAYDRDENCWPCKWGHVNGITGVKPGKGFELLPSVVSHQAGSLPDDGDFENSDVLTEVGLGLTYDISSEFTAEATINPDFSQVESDAAQIDVNSTFALFYPERRPFFQEGSDLFNTYFNAVYTRSINDPIGAGKVTGRKGSSSIAFLSARDDHSVIILPFEENSSFVENGKSFSNIVRARHDLGNQSHVGLIGTDRRFEGGGSGSLFGLDSQVRFGQSLALRMHALATHTEEVNDRGLTSGFIEDLVDAGRDTTFDEGQYTVALDGEQFWGHGLRGQLNYGASNWWADWSYQERSATFRADNGFEPQNNTRQTWVGSGYTFRFEDSKFLETIQPSFDSGRKWNFAGEQKDEWFNANFSVNLRAAQTSMHARYMRSNELFGNTQFDGIWLGHICLHSQPSEIVGFGGNFNIGDRIARYDLVMGDEISYGGWIDLKPLDRLFIAVNFNYISSENKATGEELFSGYITRSRINFQVTRELSTRFVVQYNDFAQRWEFDPLITYRLNPLSIFYIGSTMDREDLNLADDGRQGWHLTHRQYFMKLQYLFQL